MTGFKLQTNAANANAAAITVLENPKTLIFLLGLDEAIVLVLQMPKVIKTNDREDVFVHFSQVLWWRGMFYRQKVGPSTCFVKYTPQHYKLKVGDNLSDILCHISWKYHIPRTIMNINSYWSTIQIMTGVINGVKINIKSYLNLMYCSCSLQRT